MPYSRGCLSRGSISLILKTVTGTKLMDLVQEPSAPREASAKPSSRQPRAAAPWRCWSGIMLSNELETDLLQRYNIYRCGLLKYEHDCASSKMRKDSLFQFQNPHISPNWLCLNNKRAKRTRWVAPKCAALRASLCGALWRLVLPDTDRIQPKTGEMFDLFFRA